MDEMIEGTRINFKRDGTFDAEVVMGRTVVWMQAGYRTREAAQDAATNKLRDLKRVR